MICEEKSKYFLVYTKTYSSTQECNMIWHVESIIELECIQGIYMITNKNMCQVKSSPFVLVYERPRSQGIVHISQLALKKKIKRKKKRKNTQQSPN